MFDWKSLISPSIGTALNTAGGLLQGAFNYRYQKKLAAQQFGYTNQLMDKENQFNLDMWNRQNEYNDPAHQAQRFQDAGFNPALMMGQGATAAQELTSENPQFAMPSSTNVSFGSLGSEAISAYIGTKQMLADLKLKEANANKAVQDTLTSGSQQTLNEANAHYQQLLSSWESMSQETRLKALQEQIDLWSSQRELADTNKKALEQELPYISQLKEAELKEINKSIEEAASRIITNHANANKMNAEARKATQEAVYYSLLGDVAKSEKALKDAETAFYKTNDQKARFEGLKILEETKKAAEEAAKEHTKRVFLRHGWNPDGNILNNAAMFFMRSVGSFTGNGVNRFHNGAGNNLPFNDTEFDGSSIQEIENKLDSELTRALAGNHHHVYRNPNSFRMMV